VQDEGYMLPNFEEQCVDDYMVGRGQWDASQYGLSFRAMAPELGLLVGQLARDCRGTKIVQPKHLPHGIAITVTGPPLSGKSALAQYLSTTYGLRVSVGPF
jgi:hypothetical protein